MTGEVRVYFDEDAATRDGLGWTVDDGGAIVSRFRDEEQARNMASPKCARCGVPARIHGAHGCWEWKS